MPLTDDKGIEHIVSTDDVSSWGIAHLTQCKWCQERFPNSLAKLKRQGYQTVSDQFEMKKEEDDSVEWYFRQLGETDKAISELIRKRGALRETIHARMAKLNEAIYSSDDWFEGDVKGMPVPARNEANQSDPTAYMGLNRERPNGF